MRITGVPLVVGLVAVAVVVASAVAAADPPNPHQAEVDKLFADGRALIAKNDAKGACDVFTKAYSIDPKAPGVLLNLGLCNEMLKKYGTSLRWFRRAQSVAAESKIDDYRAAAEEHTVALVKLASTLTIDASQAPVDVTVRIDNEIVGRDGFPLYEIDDGDHVLEATAKDKQKLVQKLAVKPKSQQTVVLQFKDKLPPIVVDRGSGRKHASYGLFVGGLGLGGLCLWFNIHTGNQAASHDFSQNDKKNHDTEVFRKRYIGTGMFVGSAAAIGASILLYVTAPGKEYKERNALLVPTIGPDGLGIAFSRGF